MNILGRKAAIFLSTYFHSPFCHSKLLAGVIFIKSSDLHTTLSPALAALWQNLPHTVFPCYRLGPLEALLWRA